MTTFLKSLAVRPLPVCVAFLIAAPAVWADTTNISDQPLATLPNVSAAPNLLFILDSSGSMASAYMPDDMNRTAAYGFYSAQCNGVAYDPSHTYTPPVDYAGTAYIPPTYPTAYTDGYNTSSGSVDLSAAYYYTYSGTQPKMGWTYPISGKYPDGTSHTSATVDKSTTFYQECNTSKSATGYAAPVGGTAFNSGSSTNPGYGVFTPVNVSDLTAAQKQNYVNWYSYYRTRILMMRTAMGQGINPLSSSYNVGFTTISDTSATPSSTFLDVKSFDTSGGTTSQKYKFYSDLYAAQPNNATPLRAAIAKAGQYYADKASGQTYDPMQYACQRNYALLSTDGYWNTGVESTTAPKYGPYMVNNSTSVGNQDAAEIAPMKDNSFVTTTTQTTYTSNANAATRTATTTQTTTTTWVRNALTTSSSNTAGKGYKVTSSQPQKYSKTATVTQTCTQQQTATASYVKTNVDVDGTTTSNTTSSVGYTSWVNSGTASCTPSSTTATQPSGGSWSNQGSATNYNGSHFYSSSAVSSGYLSSSYTGSTFYYDPTSGTASVGTTTVTSTSNSDPVVSGTYTAATPSSSSVTTGAASNTLADVAEYYYKTDLRNKAAFDNCISGSTARDVCQDDVPTDASSGDTEKIQHMNTFTLGLGVNGTLPYDSTVTPTSGTTMDWPTPANTSNGGDATNVDDLWHAALNGRGHYYSVASASELSSAIAAVVAKIQAVNGSGAAGATSSLQLVSGGNQVFKASYTTVEWTGDVQAYALTAATAAVASTPDWSAQALLDSLSLSSRKVYFNQGGTLGVFKYSNLSTAQKAYFDNFCSMSVVASQCTALAALAADGTTLPNLTTANNGSNLVDYLAGTRTYERSGVAVTGGSTTMPLYRTRTHLLGDIVDGAPVYVGKPPFSYVDAGYSDFVTAQASRAPVVYTAANDGMLHAFSAASGSTGGTELWAFVPSAVMPNLYKLASTGYSSNHQYFVDGAPVMGDVYIGGHWKTILVGGFNDGGRGYYALDITDPSNPALLWEFSDSNLGLSYGNPVITKRKLDGSWVVVFGSGYNNTSGDGNGHLFVIDAASGSKLLDICTDGSSAGTLTGGCSNPVGSVATPSGLAKINAWVESNSTDNTALRFYGGDLLGNVWRFDIDNQVAPNQAALLLATLKDASPTPQPQPITTKPLLSAVGSTSRPVVVVATGSYLSQPDTLTTTQQSIYAIADNLTTTGWGDPRNGANSADFVVQTFTASTGSGTPTESISSNTVNFSLSTVGGWYVDLPHSGERVFSNPTLELNTLAVSTGIPNSDACTSGGSSWLYFLNVANGNAVTTNPVGVQYSSEALIVGMNWVKDTSGNVHILVQDSKGGLAPVNPPVNQGSSPNSTHRTSWRELTN